MVRFKQSAEALKSLFNYLKSYKMILTHEFKALYDKKSEVEARIIAAQHQIGLI